MSKVPIMQVRFYAAELVLGLEHIHFQNIVYRDLKVQSACQFQNEMYMYKRV